MAKKIMIVDDDLTFLDFASSCLEAAGYEVSPHNEGRGAAEKAACQQPDLILLDLAMPDLNGFSVLKILRKEPSTRGIPVIVCTGAIEFVRQQEELLAHINNVDILEKPFALHQLLTKVERATCKR